MKRLIQVFGLLILFALIVAALLPTLISVRGVNQFLLSSINKSTSVKIAAENIYISWLYGIKVDGLSMTSSHGQAVATCQKIIYDRPLLSLLYSPRRLGKVEIKQPVIRLTENATKAQASLPSSTERQKPSLLETEKPIASSSSSQKALPKISASVDVDDASIIITNANQPEIRVTELSCEVVIEEGKTAEISLAGNIETDGKPGSIQLTTTVSNLSELADTYKDVIENLLAGTQIPNSETTVSFQVKADHFPLAIVDSFLAIGDPKYSTLATKAIGPVLEGSISHTFANQAVTFSADMHAEHLTLLVKNNVGSLIWNVEPELMQIFQPLLPETLPRKIALGEPFRLQMQFDPKQTSFLTLESGNPLVLESSDWEKPLIINGKCQVSSPSVKEAIKVSGIVDMRVEKRQGKALFDATLSNPFGKQTLSFSTKSTGNWPCFASLFVKEGPCLEDLIGKTIHLESSIEIKDFDQLSSSGSLNLQSEHLHIETAFATKDELIKLSSSTITASLPSTEIAKLVAAESELSFSDAAAKVTIRSLDLPFDFSSLKNRGAADLSIELRPLTLSGLEQIESIHLKETEITVSKQPKQDMIVSSSLKAHLEKVPEGWEGFETISMILKAPVAIDQNIVNLDAIQGRVTTEEALGFDVTMPVKIDLINKKIDGKLALQSLHKKAVIQSTFSATFEPLFIRSEGSIKDLSTQFIGSLAKKPELATLLGPEISSRWNINFDSTLKQGQPCELALEGKDLSFKLAVSLGKEVEAINKKNPFTLQSTLTPDHFQALVSLLKTANPDQVKKLSLENPFALDVTCTAINFPLEKFLDKNVEVTVPSLLDALNLNLEIGVGKLDFISEKVKKEKAQEKPRQEQLSIDPLTGTASLQGKQRTLFFDLHSKKSSQGNAAQLNINGEAKNLWNDMEWQPAKASVKFRAVVKEFPLEVLQMEEVVAVAGTKMNADINANIEQLREGTFRGTISTPKISSSVDFALQEGNLTLRQPLTAQYELTQEAGEVLLKGINPLLASAARSEKPITLWIDDKDFNMPINPFSLKDMVIKTVKVDPGILTVKNKGFITLLVSLLKIPVSNGELPLWFTPIYIDIKNGIVTCNRTDTLVANAFPIATWGTIDLVKDQLDMILGLSGVALARGFRVTSVNPDYILQIPVKGSIQSPKFDTTRATAKITALNLLKTKSNTTALLGGILDVASSIGNKEAKPPAPTTQPFPWDEKQQQLNKDSRRGSSDRS